MVLLLSKETGRVGVVAMNLKPHMFMMFMFCFKFIIYNHFQSLFMCNVVLFVSLSSGSGKTWEV